MIFVKPLKPFLAIFIISTIALMFFFSNASFTYTVDSKEDRITLDSPLAVAGVSVVFGLVAAGSITAILYAVGVIESPSSRLYPEVKSVSREELIKRLLALNSPNLPWEIIKGEKTDLVARWKIADAKWWEILKRAGLKIHYLGRMRLDDENKRVLYNEELGELEWAAGLSETPVKFGYRKFRGRMLFNKRKAVGYAFKKLYPPDWGKVYQFDFDVNLIRGPIIETVEKSGWLFQPVAGIRHVLKRSGMKDAH